MKLEWKLFTAEEATYFDEQWAYSSLVEKCRLWAVSMCQRARGHDWYLEIDPDEGVHLSCRKCPAGADDVYPDGIDMLTGEFEVYPGYVLSLHTGDVHVNGEFRDGHVYGWRGPVAVDLHTEKYTSMDWVGYEYDAWIEVEPR